jgi:hypothetical protein
MGTDESRLHDSCEQVVECAIFLTKVQGSDDRISIITVIRAFVVAERAHLGIGDKMMAAEHIDFGRPCFHELWFVTKARGC